MHGLPSEQVVLDHPHTGVEVRWVVEASSCDTARHAAIADSGGSMDEHAPGLVSEAWMAAGQHH